MLPPTTGDCIEHEAEDVISFEVTTNGQVPEVNKNVPLAVQHNQPDEEKAQELCLQILNERRGACVQMKTP